MRNLPAPPEGNWLVTFEDDGYTFIQARDEAHVRRIIENNGLWNGIGETKLKKHTIKSIELA